MTARRFALRPALLALAASLLATACVTHAWRIHGENEFSGASLTVGELLADAEAHDGQTVVVRGDVAEVCLKKGCWLLLKDGVQEVRVTFKDHAFFVPTDCAGAPVEVKGVFVVEQVPADVAAHFLRDGGHEAEAAAITGPVPGFTLVATGARFPLRPE